MNKPICTLKVGTSALTQDDGRINTEIMQEICRQIALLKKEYDIILVSSGAVAQGKFALKKYSGKIMEKKAAAAVGNPILIQQYAECFKPFNMTVAQILCVRENFSNRIQFVQLKETIRSLWKHDILPIMNENDVISDFELRFSDNDDLATLISVGFPVKKLLLGTDIKGLLNGDELVTQIDKFDSDVYQLIHNKSSPLGLGGMASKLNAAKQATKMGVETVIFDIRQKDNILRAEKGLTGSHCPAKESTISTRNKWMACGGSVCSAKVIIDSGAAVAVNNRNGLLYVGVKEILGDFKRGEIFEIFEEGKEDNLLAVARARLPTSELTGVTDRKNVQLANPNQITLISES